MTAHLRESSTMRKVRLVIDGALIQRAGEVLGMQGIQATIDGALHEVVEADARRRSVEQLRTMDGLDLDQPEVTDQAWR
jgi:Arc/MetJ family transcription regulator